MRYIKNTSKKKVSFFHAGIHYEILGNDTVGFQDERIVDHIVENMHGPLVETTKPAQEEEVQK